MKRRKKSIEKPSRESTLSLAVDNVEEPSLAKSSYGSGTKGRTSGARKPTMSATLQINTKRKQTKRATATHPSTPIVKDDSDNDNEPGNGDIDPDEPTYCLCEQVTALVAFNLYYLINYNNFLLDFIWRDDRL